MFSTWASAVVDGHEVTESLAAEEVATSDSLTWGTRKASGTATEPPSLCWISLRA
jgi:hypothetical protein